MNVSFGYSEFNAALFNFSNPRMDREEIDRWKTPRANTYVTKDTMRCGSLAMDTKVERTRKRLRGGKY